MIKLNVGFFYSVDYDWLKMNKNSHLLVWTLLGRPTRRWEDNIRMDLRDIVWEGVH
jgi:hypothetical protein